MKWSPSSQIWNRKIFPNTWATSALKGNSNQSPQLLALKRCRNHSTNIKFPIVLSTMLISENGWKLDQILLWNCECAPSTILPLTSRCLQETWGRIEQLSTKKGEGLYSAFTVDQIIKKTRVVLPTHRKLVKNTDFHANTATLLLTPTELYGSHVARHFLM